MITLNVLERVLVMSLIPKEGSLTNLKLIREAKETLSFTEEENKKLEFVENPEGGVRWTTTNAHHKITGIMAEGLEAVAANPDDYEQVPTVGEKEFDLGGVVTALIVKKLVEMDKTETLTEEFMPIYEKFVA